MNKYVAVCAVVALTGCTPNVWHDGTGEPVEFGLLEDVDPCAGRGQMVEAYRPTRQEIPLGVGFVGFSKPTPTARGVGFKGDLKAYRCVAFTAGGVRETVVYWPGSL